MLEGGGEEGCQDFRSEYWDGDVGVGKQGEEVGVGPGDGEK